MRILLVHDYGTLVGGAERSVFALRDGLVSRGHEVRLLTGDRHRTGEGPSLADVTCRGADHDRLATVVRLANPSAHRTLQHELATFEPDVVHIRMFLTQLSPLILRLLRDTPTIHHVSWYRPICPRGTKLLPDGSLCEVAAGRPCLTNRCVTPLSWPFDMLQLAAYSSWRTAIDRTVTISRSAADRLNEAGIGPVTVIENAVEPSDARPPLTGAPRLCFAGRLVHEKGLDVLLDAMTLLDDQVVLDVLGTGPEADASRQRTTDLGLGDRVTWHGHLTGPELSAVLDRAWVQVAPHRWEEPFGNVVTEAMARGTAVVASDLGGPAEVIDHLETGLLVPPDDPGGLADAIASLVQAPATCEKMGAAGREVARSRFSIDRLLDDCERLYVELAPEPTSHRRS